jgi:flavodoxin I
MATIGIFYGSNTGNTESAAKRIAAALGDQAAEPTSIADTSADELSGYSALIFGASTWGVGDIQDDWDDKLSMVTSVDFSGKKVAIFGLGDQKGYADTFVDAIGVLANIVRKGGGTVVGQVSTDGYEFDESQAVEGDVFLGLPLDEDNESDRTDERIEAWTATLKNELG